MRRPEDVIAEVEQVAAEAGRVLVGRPRFQPAAPPTQAEVALWAEDPEARAAIRAMAQAAVDGRHEVVMVPPRDVIALLDILEAALERGAAGVRAQHKIIRS